jgi:hypothetical protein
MSGIVKFAIKAIMRRTGGRADSREVVDPTEFEDPPANPEGVTERGNPSDELPGRDGGRFPLKKSPNWYEYSRCTTRSFGATNAPESLSAARSQRGIANMKPGPKNPKS